MTNRRNFLKSSALGAAGLCTFHLPASAQGANERLRIGVLGVGSRGNDHCKEFSSMENVELAAVADPDQYRSQGTKKRWEEKTGKEILAFQDPRKIIEDPSIDAVSVASCNHWHALLSLWAAETGKHVYVEKPCSHTLFEGRQLVNAMKKYSVCIQHGSQRRSGNQWYQAAAAFRSGKYGKPKALFAYANRTRLGIGYQPKMDPPAHLDWNLWLGPADYEPYHANLVPYKWHFFWNTGDGEIGNNGVHFFDGCRIAAGDPHAHAKSVLAFGTRVVRSEDGSFKDQGETPSIQAAVYDFNGLPCYFTSCSLRKKDSTWKPLETARFYTDEGYVTEYGTFVSNSGETTKLDVEFQKPQPGGHFVNFVTCIRENTPEKLNAPIVEGHYSTAFCHLGNISYRTGRDASLAECLEAIGDEPILRARLDETLKNAQDFIPEISLEKDVRFTLGTKLEMDSETEKFTNCEAANALLRKPGRGEFVVREY